MYLRGIDLRLPDEKRRRIAVRRCHSGRLKAPAWKGCLLIAAFFPLVSCHDTQNPNGFWQKSGEVRSLRWTGHTMGTTYHIQVHFPDTQRTDEQIQSALKKEVEICLEQINRCMSTYDPESELSAFNRMPPNQWHPVSPSTASVVAAALSYHKQTNGALDVTVGPLMRLWGFGAQESDPRSTLPTTDQIRAVRARVGCEYLQVRHHSHAGLRKTVAGVEIDLSALAKGYAVDQLVVLLRKAGGAGGVVEIGGEIRTWGRRKDGQCWRIGIEKPLAGERTLAHIIRLEEAALATSGDYRNFRSLEGKQLCHLIDPRTGTPLPAREMSVSVCAKTCMESDALATALFLMGKEKGLAWSESRGVAAMFLTVENGKLTEKYSSHFEAYLR